MLHSVIIPHYRREEHLVLCIKALARAAIVSDANFEVIVTGEIDPSQLANFPAVRYVHCAVTPPILLNPDEPPPYWKTRALNVGMKAATGDVLTFLDSDSLVGKHFFRGGEAFLASSLQRLCYRARYIDAEKGQNWWAYFCEYDRHPKAFEAYGRIDAGSAGFCLPIYGNSQFTVRKNCGVEWDESYYGRGFEDLDFIRRFHERYGDTTAIMTDGDYAMFQIKNQAAPGFNNDRFAQRNERKFYGRKTVWVVSDRRSVLESCSKAVNELRNAVHHFEYTLTGDFPVREIEVLPGDIVCRDLDARQLLDTMRKEGLL